VPVEEVHHLPLAPAQTGGLGRCHGALRVRSEEVLLATEATRELLLLEK